MEKLEGEQAKIFMELYDDMKQEVLIQAHKAYGLDSDINIKIQGKPAAVMTCMEVLAYDCIKQILGEGFDTLGPEKCKEQAKEFLSILMKNLHERLEGETWNIEK